MTARAAAAPVSGNPGPGISAATAPCRRARTAEPAALGVRTAGMVLLPWAPASVAVARQRLAADLSAAGIFDAAVRDAVLVVSELLSNAIRHARPLPGANVQVAWALGNGAVEVAVSDGGATTSPARAHASVSALGGRGLDIVEYLARRWGVRSDDSGQTVWAILSAPQPGGSRVLNQSPPNSAEARQA